MTSAAAQQIESGLQTVTFVAQYHYPRIAGAISW